MNIQQYFDEKEQNEREKVKKEEAENAVTASSKSPEQSTVIPVVQEEARIQTVQQDTAKVKVHKKVIEVEKHVDIPLLQERYDIEHVAVNQFVDTAPPVREEEDRIIVPVVREVLVVEKRLELVEEVHLIKRTTTVHHQENFTLKKEEVQVERTSTDNQQL